MTSTGSVITFTTGSMVAGTGASTTVSATLLKVSVKEAPLDIPPVRGLLALGLAGAVALGAGAFLAGAVFVVAVGFFAAMVSGPCFQDCEVSSVPVQPVDGRGRFDLFARRRFARRLKIDKYANRTDHSPKRLILLPKPHILKTVEDGTKADHCKKHLLFCRHFAALCFQVFFVTSNLLVLPI